MRFSSFVAAAALVSTVFSMPPRYEKRDVLADASRINSSVAFSICIISSNLIEAARLMGSNRPRPESCASLNPFAAATTVTFTRDGSTIVSTQFRTLVEPASTITGPGTTGTGTTTTTATTTNSRTTTTTQSASTSTTTATSTESQTSTTTATSTDSQTSTTTATSTDSQTSTTTETSTDSQTSTTTETSTESQTSTTTETSTDSQTSTTTTTETNTVTTSTTTTLAPALATGVIGFVYVTPGTATTTFYYPMSATNSVEYPTATDTAAMVTFETIGGQCRASTNPFDIQSVYDSTNVEQFVGVSQSSATADPQNPSVGANNLKPLGSSQQSNAPVTNGDGSVTQTTIWELLDCTTDALTVALTAGSTTQSFICSGTFGTGTGNNDVGTTGMNDIGAILGQVYVQSGPCPTGSDITAVFLPMDPATFNPVM